jgi:hypothetical protein
VKVDFTAPALFELEGIADWIAQDTSTVVELQPSEPPLQIGRQVIL